MHNTPENFKESFKFYKSRHPDPDFSAVVDVDVSPEKNCTQRKLENPPGDSFLPLLLIPPKEWTCYEINGRLGLIFIRNPFTTLGQRYWMARSVRDYPKAPNAVNLSSKKFDKKIIDDWWRAYSSENDRQFKDNLKTSMRWATLGYHHDWDTKVYSEAMKNEFPKDLGRMTTYFARVLGYEKYAAEAAIVNFYPIGTTLSGHTDHSEVDLDAPLFSFSFGQKAIFLIGGKTKDEPATALYLKSGDVVVMSKESRLCYHAVPRVMKDSSRSWEFTEKSNNIWDLEPPDSKRPKSDNSEILQDLIDDCKNELFWKPFDDYLQTTRININIRQVLKEGQTSL